MMELAEGVDAYEHTVRALLSLGRDCSATDFARPTECPGWTVQDQFSHVVGIEGWLLGRPEPAHELPEGMPHLRSRFAHRVEVPVDLRRSRTGAEVVAELAEVLVARLTWLRAPTVSGDDVVVNPLGGEAPLRDVLALRTFDIWTHEQDVRRALGRPGNLGSPAAAVAVSWIRRSLPRVVARGAQVPVGGSVTFEVSGPVQFTETVRVATGDDGRPIGVAGKVVDPADVRIGLGTEAFMRRMCGRWSAADTPVSVAGDGELGAQVLEAMAVTP